MIRIRWQRWHEGVECTGPSNANGLQRPGGRIRWG
jgi:hypothetical protein